MMVKPSGKPKVFQHIFANAHGQFRAFAKRHGMTTQEAAEHFKHAPGHVGDMARAALTGMKFAKHKRNK